jgi:hypothetical protein
MVEDCNDSREKKMNNAEALTYIHEQLLNTGK